MYLFLSPASAGAAGASEEHGARAGDTAARAEDPAPQEQRTQPGE